MLRKPQPKPNEVCDLPKPFRETLVKRSMPMTWKPICAGALHLNRSQVGKLACPRIPQAVMYLAPLLKRIKTVHSNIKQI